VEMVENGMVLGRGFEYEAPRIICTCYCGCGRPIYEGYEHILYDGQWLYDTECLVEMVGAEWAVVGE